MTNNNLFNEEVGLLKTGTIVGYDPTDGMLQVQLNNSSVINGNRPLPLDVPAPHSLFYNNGLFIGSLPVIGTPIVIGQGSGGQHYFVSWLAENLPVIPDLTLGELLIHAKSDTKITLDTKNNISIGSDSNRIHVNTKSNFITTNFYNENHFSQAARRVEGLVKRDLKFNTNFDSDSKLENDDYDSFYTIIGLDPTVTTNSSLSGSNKNPPFVEQREIIYEFQNISNVADEFNESLLYGKSNETKRFKFPNRRNSRADTLSLTLAAPNYLIETIKGTVVDIFGNILDINRTPLPIGKEQNTLRDEKSTDKIKSYLKIRELERKSLAYHFELNARKDLVGNNQRPALPNINSNADYARNRSRFFFDIDKEGQLKINVPASSETGNIPLLTRYENYSSFGSEDNNNPNKLIYRKDNLDIFLDSFAAPLATKTTDGFSYSKERGSIKLINNNTESAPLDRITESHIKHGTVYHDILQTCYAHQTSDFLNYQAEVFITIDTIPLLNNVVSDTIIVGGKEANAGGRSGSINFDGSIELNVGANTVDRQSIWLDTAGGVVGNFGRDLKNRSAALTMNGDVYLQIGGFGVSTDSRFEKQNNKHYGAVLDIRVLNSGGRAALFRFDDEGLKIMTPSNLSIHAAQDLKISSDKNIAIECESLTVQGRLVQKEFGGSI